MKRKIKDFNDFLDCIKAGKKVTEGNGEWFYFWENGYICSKNKDGFGWYNTSVDTEDLSRMDVEENEQFKIEVGKFYRTRSGKKAYCIYKEKGDLYYPNYCVIVGSDCKTSYTEGGLVFYDEENPEDIVGYWEE